MCVTRYLGQGSKTSDEQDLGFDALGPNQLNIEYHFIITGLLLWYQNEVGTY